jgi:hypothetical protein
MADRPPDPDDTDVEPTTGTPRWVKVFGIIGLVLVLLFVTALLIGGHGPDRHTLSVTEHVQQP